MKIDAFKTPYGNNEKKITEVREKDMPGLKEEAKAQAEDYVRGDVVQLSERSRLVAKAQELAAGAPELRQENIDELKGRIAAGTYNVSGRSIAEAMIRKSITEV